MKDLGDGEANDGDDDGDNNEGEGDVHGYARLFQLLMTFITFHLSFIMILLVLFHFFYLS